MSADMTPQGQQPVVALTTPSVLFSSGSAPQEGVGPLVTDEPAPKSSIADAQQRWRTQRTAKPEVVAKTYSSNEVATVFFNKSHQWVYWASRNGVFVDENGDPIEPIKIGENKKHRYTLGTIREMAAACYRRGSLKQHGFYRAIGHNEKGRVVSANGTTSTAAQDNFVKKYAQRYQIDEVVFLPGLEDILDKIRAEENDRLILA